MNQKSALFLMFAFLLLYGCGRKEASGDENISKYEYYLTQLSASDFYSIQKGIDNYKSYIPNSNQAVKDSAFILFRYLYYHVINVCSENFWNNHALVTKLTASAQDPEVTEFKNKMEANGLRLSISEGDYYIDEQPDFLLNTFKGYLSSALREYLELRKKELEEGFSENARLLISFRSLGDRIITWENYIIKYPASPLLAEAKFSYQLYLNTFITGLDNFPIAEDQKLSPQIKSEYENFIAQHKDKISGKLVENYYNILAQQNFILTPGLNDFYSENGIESMLGVQPPTR